MRLVESIIINYELIPAGTAIYESVNQIDVLKKMIKDYYDRDKDSLVDIFKLGGNRNFEDIKRAIFDNRIVKLIYKTIRHYDSDKKNRNFLMMAEIIIPHFVSDVVSKMTNIDAKYDYDHAIDIIPRGLLYNWISKPHNVPTSLLEDIEDINDSMGVVWELRDSEGLWSKNLDEEVVSAGYDTRDLNYVRKIIKDLNPQRSSTISAAYNMSFNSDYEGLTLNKILEMAEESKPGYRDTSAFEPVETYRNYNAYKISNLEQSEALCWRGNVKTKQARFCVLGRGFAEHYGGYPFYVITKGRRGSEKLFCVYLPNLLKAGEQPDQAVRNASNTGPLNIIDYKDVKELLIKLDDAVIRYDDYYLGIDQDPINYSNHELVGN